MLGQRAIGVFKPKADQITNYIVAVARNLSGIERFAEIPRSNSWSQKPAAEDDADRIVLGQRSSEVMTPKKD